MTPAPLTSSDKRAFEVAFGNTKTAQKIYERFDGLGDAGTVGSSLTVKEMSAGIMHQTEITLTAFAVSITDTGGANGAYGSKKVYDFPTGLIRVLEARTVLALTAASGIGATGTVKHSLGTVAVSTSDTLSSTLANIIASVSQALTGSAATAKGSGVSTPPQFDGTSSAAACYLNFGVADADVTANSTITVTGTITITWIKGAAA